MYMKSEPGDFTFMKSIIWQDNLTDAYNATNAVGDEAWRALQIHDPKHSFMFETRGPIWDRIRAEMTLGQTGTSYSISMRAMESIAKKGWNNFVNSQTEPRRD